MKETRGGRSVKSPGKCPATQLPCSSRSPHPLSIARANLLGERPHAGKKWNHLNSSNIYLAHSAVLLFLTVPSSVPVTTVSRHIKDVEEARWDSLGLLFSPPSHFVANFDSLLLQCPDSLRQIFLRKGERDGRWKFRHFSAYSAISVLSSFSSPPPRLTRRQPPTFTAASE